MFVCTFLDKELLKLIVEEAEEISLLNDVDEKRLNIARLGDDVTS